MPVVPVEEDVATHVKVADVLWWPRTPQEVQTDRLYPQSEREQRHEVLADRYKDPLLLWLWTGFLSTSSRSSDLIEPKILIIPSSRPCTMHHAQRSWTSLVCGVLMWKPSRTSTPRYNLRFESISLSETRLASLHPKDTVSTSRPRPKSI